MDRRVTPRDMVSVSSEPHAVAGAAIKREKSSGSGDEQPSEDGDDDDDYAGVEDMSDDDEHVNEESDDDEHVHEQSEDEEDEQEESEDEDVNVDDDADVDEDDNEDMEKDEDEGEESFGSSRLRQAVQNDLIDEFERTEEKRIASDMTANMDVMFLQDDSQPATRRTSMNSDILPDIFDMNVNMDEDPFLGLASHDDVYRDLYDEAEELALASWRIPERQDSQDSIVATKRVRFMEPQETRSRSSSLSSDEEDPSEAFPDLFAAQDDPMQRSRLGLDLDLDLDFQNDYSDAGSCYDFDGEEERLALAIDEEDSDSDDMSSSEDDDGDTTDEEPEEALLARAPAARGTTRSPTLPPATPMPSKRLVIRQTRTETTPLATPKTGKGPKMGTFAVDKSRATISADTIGSGIKVLPPSKPSEKDKAFWERAKTAASSRSGTPRSSGYWNMRTPGPAVPQRPFTAQSTLGSMFNGNLDILHNNDVSGIAGDLFPAMLPRHESSFVTASIAGESDDELLEVNMEDFVDMDQSSSEEEEEDQSSALVTSPSQAAQTPDGQTQSRNDRLLAHLAQSGLVGSFRRNQNNAKLLSSLAANPASRASTSEHNALQKGKRAAANIPVTPARKKRVSQDLTGAGVRKGANSPLANRRPRSRGSSMSQRLGLSSTQ